LLFDNSGFRVPEKLSFVNNFTFSMESEIGKSYESVFTQLKIYVFTKNNKKFLDISPKSS